MWLRLPSDPVVAALKVVCEDPSPQLTSTAHGLSGPGSVNDPSVNDVAAPSFAVWSDGAVTDGFAFVT